METADQAIRFPIQRFPNEVLARLFIVGSWLPGRLSEHCYSASRDNMNPLQLKPYAKLVSQVCARWRNIVHWRSHGRMMYYASISLVFVETGNTTRKNIVPVLKAYLDGIKNSEDAELYVGWYFYSKRELLLPLFLHGMNLTAPHFNRIRSLRVTSTDSTISVFCFSLLNSLSDDTVLTHLNITDWSPEFTVRPEPPLMPICAPFNGSPIGTTLHPKALLTALSDLYLSSNTNIVEKLIIPANLLHLTLKDLSDSATWNDLWAVLLQCGSLRTLSISSPSSASLPGLSDKRAINLLCLSELTIFGAKVPEMPILLPLLITPRLKYLYLAELYYDGHTEIEGKSTGQSVAATRPEYGMNSADSPAHSVRTFAAPPHLRILVEEQYDMQTAVAKLFASMTLDAVEILSFDDAPSDSEESDGEESADPVASTTSSMLSYRHHGSPSSLARTIFDLFQEHCSKAKGRDMPEIRITAEDGKIRYSTLDHAESYITHENQNKFQASTPN